ncbi:methyltransferase domain-containing protein [Aliisedimentitalea scapharcae]|uniref:Methyltransferase domain-containing protein n=1 Tax=Aliisedimentitalea scapharcae TaxID=1524259 RepID=A0ABZ2XWV4_9RHOB
MQASAKFWDGIAEKYARNPISDMASYQHTLDRTASYLGAEDTVLELGCGTGSTALELASGVRQFVASDVAEGMLTIGKNRASEQGVGNVDFVQADVMVPPKGPFDAVLAFNVLHLLDDLDTALISIRDSVKPNGFFISKTFCTPQDGGSWKYKLLRMGLPILQLVGKAPYVRFLQVEELDSALERAGFEIVEQDSFPARNARRFLVARRL